MSEYTIFIAAPNNSRGKVMWINANQRLHWAQKADMTRTWRLLALHTARATKLPKGLQRVHVTAHVHKTNKRAYDVHNLYGTCKAIMDGLVDHGLIEDDHNDHLEGPDLRRGEVRDNAGIRLVIRDLSDETR